MIQISVKFGEIKPKTYQIQEYVAKKTRNQKQARSSRDEERSNSVV
jgi:hypothetical protein